MILHAATSNPGKLAEFATSAATAGVEVLALPGLATMPEPVEDADTFAGNAALKAIAYSLLAPGLIVLSDDSGIALDALHGAPGVRSARFADVHSSLSSVISTEASRLHAMRSGETRTSQPPTRDDRNNALLLHLMAPHTDRTAHFLCALALARDGQILLRAEGLCTGQLLTAPRGDHGFGYDPLFLLPTLHLTMAELPREQKWQLSHRGNAFRALLEQLSDFIPELEAPEPKPRTRRNL
jgi:XTP/dITP diphosphohydrolase